MIPPAVVQEAIEIAEDLLGEKPTDDAVRVIRDNAKLADPTHIGRMIAQVHTSRLKYYGRLMEEPAKGEQAILT